MRITNKQKQAKSELKKPAARLLRRKPIDAPARSHSKLKKHHQNRCPICSAAIAMTASGGRRKHSCSSCGATLNKLLTCASCNTNRVWQGKQGAACCNCGAIYDA